MKIIKRDNFDRENVSEGLVAENVTEENGQLIVTALNETSQDVWFYKVVPDNYQLYIFEP